MIRHVVFDHDGTLVDTDFTPVLYQGIKEVLEYLKEQEVKIYLWTARNRASTIQILKSLEIIGFFEDINTSTDCEPKPDPSGLEMMLSGIDQDSIIHIGDSPSDIYGAHEFGCKSIGAIWASPTMSNEAQMKELKASYICKTTDECLEVLKKLIK